MSPCYRSRRCYREPTCTSRPVRLQVVAVAVQSRFHLIQHLNEVTVGARLLGWTSVQNGWSLSKCVLLFEQNVRIFTVMMKSFDD